MKVYKIEIDSSARSVYADVYHQSRSKTIKMINPQARRMVSHNKKWNYIFHLEDDIVIVDRIMPSKMIVK